MSHTKGPWQILAHNSGADGLDKPSELLMICAGDMRIANMHSAKDRTANAMLIAAAPELLEALQKIADLDPASTSNGNNEWGEAECFDSAQQIAVEAIAKAEGRP